MAVLLSPAAVPRVSNTPSDVTAEDHSSYDDSRSIDAKTSSMTGFSQTKQGGRRQSVVVGGSSTYPDAKARRGSTVSTLASSERSSTAIISMTMREPITTKPSNLGAHATGVDTTSPSSSSILSLPTPPSHHRLHHPELLAISSGTSSLMFLTPLYPVMSQLKGLKPVI